MIGEWKIDDLDKATHVSDGPTVLVLGYRAYEYLLRLEVIEPEGGMCSANEGILPAGVHGYGSDGLNLLKKHSLLNPLPIGIL